MTNESNNISVTKKENGTIKGPKVNTSNAKAASPTGLIAKGGGAKLQAGGKAESGNGKNPGSATAATTKGY